MASRDPNGRGYDPQMFEANIFEFRNRARYWVGINGPPAGDRLLRVLGSCDG